MSVTSATAIEAAVKAVQDELGALPYMTPKQANRLGRLLAEHDLRDCLELGFFHGKSSAFIAAILRALGGGHLTTIDREKARLKQPNVEAVLERLGLADWVTVHYEPRSYTWRLMKLLEAGPPPRFDFCYVDGGHYWDVSGFAFFLVDRLLRPGGWILFDDLDWTFAQRLDSQEPPDPWLARLPEEERTTPQIRKVWELLVKRHPGYDSFAEEGAWAFARKKA